MKRFLLIALAVGVAGTPRLAAGRQNPADELYQLYVESILHPEGFDAEIMPKNFTPEFMDHLAHVQARLFAEAKDDIDVCQGHSDPDWRYRCQQERPAAGLFSWTVSLKMTISQDSTWESTPQGGLITFAKKQFDIIASGSGLTWESAMRMGLQATEGMLRYYFQ